MTSPGMTIGTAGGQENEPIAAIRPSAFSKGMVSQEQSDAERIVIFFSGKTADPQTSLASAFRLGIDSRIFLSFSSSRSVFFGVIISTIISGSENSTSIFCSRRIDANSFPV